MGTTGRWTKNLLSVFAFCCVTSTHLMGLTGSGQITTTKKLTLGKISASVLSRVGPVFAAHYLANNIPLRGFVRTAPFVASYHLGMQSTATITFTVKLKKEEKSFPFHLKSTGGDDCKDWVFQLPKEFGKKARVATISVIAENLDPNDKQPPDFELCGLGMGEKAVGSLGIERVKFEAAHFRATQNEKVGYSFYSRFNFENAYAEFRLTGQASGGVVDTSTVKSVKIKDISQGEMVSKEWDGKDERGKVSKGRHLIVVSAWYREQKGGDWTAAWSRGRVLVD